jgi:hypothetical protein
MASEDETAPIKKTRSEAQIQALEKARAKARELRTQRNVIREKHNISDETDANPTDETPNDDAETENTETENSETESDEQPAAAVVEKKAKPVKKEKPKRQATPYHQPQVKPQQRDENVPIPQNFRMMSRNQFILFDE